MNKEKRIWFERKSATNGFRFCIDMSHRSTAQHCHIDTPFCTIRKSHVNGNFAVPVPHSEEIRRCILLFLSVAMHSAKMNERFLYEAVQSLLGFAFLSFAPMVQWQLLREPAKPTKSSGVVEQRVNRLVPDQTLWSAHYSVFWMFANAREDLSEHQMETVWCRTLVPVVGKWN